MNSIKDSLGKFFRPETIYTNVPQNTRFYVVLVSNSQQQSLTSQIHRHVMSIYKRVCKGYKNSGEMVKQISGTRPNITILFGILFSVKDHCLLVKTIFYCEVTTIKNKLLIWSSHKFTIVAEIGKTDSVWKLKVSSSLDSEPSQNTVQQ